MSSRSTPEQGPGRIRTWILALLVLLYVGLSAVAYSDFAGTRSEERLSDLEARGLAIWREKNCQVCHQIHGFGGFLGPDLTNRVTDTTSAEDLHAVLEFGSGRMPAFHLDPAERRAVLAFLAAVNRTGRSQPRPLAASEPQFPRTEHLAKVAEAFAQERTEEVEEGVARGMALWCESGCGTCHQPFERGRALAPDLTTWSVDRTPEGLGAILSTGAGRMPAFRLSEEEVADLSGFLEWVAGHREELQATNDQLLGREEFSWRDLPWFEYR